MALPFWLSSSQPRLTLLEGPMVFEGVEFAEPRDRTISRPLVDCIRGLKPEMERSPISGSPSSIYEDTRETSFVVF